MGVLDACGVEIKLLGSVPVRSGMFAESVKAPKGLSTGMSKESNQGNLSELGRTIIYSHLLTPHFKL